MSDLAKYIDAERCVSELETLSGFSDVPAPAVTRVVFSKVDVAARTYFTELCKSANLQVRVDPVGNIFARWIGSQPELPAVGTGSHCDAIPHSGRFDGTVGVLGGLEAIRALQASGFQPKRSIELLMFTSEEPTRYGIGCLGSRLLSGTLNLEKAAAFKDSEGKTLEQNRQQIGCAGELSDVCLPANYYDAFIELHIEQGPVLEREKLNIGIVEAIAAPAALRCCYTGVGGHAGAVLMAGRKDAMLAAAELALAVEAAALKLGTADTVATTGYVKVHPCAVNSIPSRVDLEIDVRDINAARRDEVLNSIHDSAKTIAKKRGLELSMELINADPPAQSNPEILSAIKDAVEVSGLSSTTMISRAYHDSLFMAIIAPIAMIFIPCFRGYSHRPDEFAETSDIAHGINILAQTLATLSNA